MEIWKLLVVITFCLGGVVLMLAQFVDLYGGDWSNIASTVAAAFVMLIVMCVAIVVVKRAS